MGLLRTHPQVRRRSPRRDLAIPIVQLAAGPIRWQKEKFTRVNRRVCVALNSSRSAQYATP